MKGGAAQGPIIVNERRQKNTPFRTRDESSTYRRQKEELPPQKDPNSPLLKLSLFQPQQNPGNQRPPIPTAYYPFWQPGTPFVGNLDPSVERMLQVEPNYKIPMANNYTINMAGPTGSNGQLKTLMETVLPAKFVNFNMISVTERLALGDYIMQTIGVQEGDPIGIGNASPQCEQDLLSHIKLLELNGGSFDLFSSNPFRTLPDGMLLYRSCYPIRNNMVNNSVMCARDSIGLNIRVYSLSKAEYYAHVLRTPYAKNYDVLRELAYYGYIRDNILKKIESPHFALLYTYYMSNNQAVDYFYLKTKQKQTQSNMIKDQLKEIECLREMQKEIDALFNSDCDDSKPLHHRDNLDVKLLPDEIDPSLAVYSGNMLLLLTEAPSTNFYNWASRKYENTGVIQKMVSQGYHSPDEWINVIFQIVMGLAVMQRHNIVMRNMTLEDNVYIKDLFVSSNQRGYWKYVINGFHFYLPNLGSLVMLDTNFKDIIVDKPTDLGTNIKRINKLYIDELPNSKQLVYQNYKRLISPNIFGRPFMQSGVYRPEDQIMTLLENLYTDNEEDLSTVLVKHFPIYLNNRIGTKVRKSDEMPNVKDMFKEFKEGEMAIQVMGGDEYKWVMIRSIRDGIATVYTRNEVEEMPGEDGIVERNRNPVIEENIQVTNLKQYQSQDYVQQYNNGINSFDKKSLIETYVVS